jgi:hypothetical protein
MPPKKNKRKEAAAMVTKKVLNPNRVRRIEGGFSFIPHRFLTDGFLSSLTQKEILLYFFLILASDRCGLSFYCYDAICALLQISLDQYIEARDSLIRKDLIAFDGTLFQVLGLPESPLQRPPMKTALTTDRPPQRRQIATLIQQSLWGG